jgi:hypothetical protein
VHDLKVIEVTGGPFKKEALGSNPHSGAYDNKGDYVAKNAADLETNSRFLSAHRKKEEDFRHMKDTWACHDFNRTGIAPIHHAIRTYGDDPGHLYPGDWHLKSWLVETSADRQNSREVASEERNRQLNDTCSTSTFAVVDLEEFRFIRLVNIVPFQKRL